MRTAGAGEEDKAIRALGERWARAISEADIAQLDSLIADDALIIHGDGRCVSGRSAILADLSAAFARVRLTQRIDPQETIVTGDWAIDRSRVHTTVITMGGAEQLESDSHALTILRKAEPYGWRVARVIGVVERPERWK